MLYIVPTPIGNLEDMTLRSIRVLKEVSLILAEDTRQFGKLKNHFEIQTPTTAYHAHNEHQHLNQFLERVKAGEDIALVTDAGTPGISDPGFLLSRACMEAGVQVTTLPGATAFVPALVTSGIPCDKFYFEGFLPHKKGRKTRLEYLSALEQTFVLYESPFRLLKCLNELAMNCGEERIASVSRELTKIHEETQTGSLRELIKYFSEKSSIKGEIVVVVSGTA